MNENEKNKRAEVLDDQEMKSPNLKAKQTSGDVISLSRQFGEEELSITLKCPDSTLISLSCPTSDRVTGSGLCIGCGDVADYCCSDYENGSSPSGSSDSNWWESGSSGSSGSNWWGSGSGSNDESDWKWGWGSESGSGSDQNICYPNSVWYHSQYLPHFTRENIPSACDNPVAISQMCQYWNRYSEWEYKENESTFSNGAVYCWNGQRLDCPWESEGDKTVIWGSDIANWRTIKGLSCGNGKTYQCPEKPEYCYTLPPYFSRTCRDHITSYGSFWQSIPNKFSIDENGEGLLECWDGEQVSSSKYDPDYNYSDMEILYGDDNYDKNVILGIKRTDDTDPTYCREKPICPTFP